MAPKYRSGQRVLVGDEHALIESVALDHSSEEYYYWVTVGDKTIRLREKKIEGFKGPTGTVD